MKCNIPIVTDGLTTLRIAYLPAHIWEELKTIIAPEAVIIMLLPTQSNMVFYKNDDRLQKMVRIQNLLP